MLSSRKPDPSRMQGKADYQCLRSPLNLVHHMGAYESLILSRCASPGWMRRKPQYRMHSLLQWPHRMLSSSKPDPSGKADYQCLRSPLDLVHHMGAYESLILSRCASPGCIRREKLRVDKEMSRKLAESGVLTDGYMKRFNAAVDAACNEYSKRLKECHDESHLTISRLDPKTPDLKKVTEFQADLCVSFDEDTDLETIFKDVIDQPAADVKIFGQPGVSYEHFEIRKGEYMCFEITEKPGKVFEKLFQVNRLYNVLKDDMIGADTKIAAMGLLMNGKREEFEIVSLCMREFFSLASDAKYDLAPMVEPARIPFFLMYTPYRNIFGVMQDLKNTVESKFNRMDGKLDELNRTMGLVLKHLNIVP
ncbi:hypothetical protein GUITHDRAFT_100214 [Guillardia theta CCMP2712]|uniref:Uncharacterized protein n=1 Tax=Guillardia theta (strain CCMP2712) TaxID=905079 RepID=L1K082_GUITC|nr:hypothetical protein GUITHDRAFT_100214 [Guillardia theta CCMP2712]EKX53964.1 hypothetical protein GUITHDRAFT_100214 [Guillardia theta CCMP2712]|eukprot:XP_005840944.1 hypothetical protein GUITHDRAFT_100214 [Guillardia theta CCMP2712]